MGPEENREIEKNYRNFMRRLGNDPELRGRVRANPSGVLEEQGVDLLPEAEIRVVEDSAEVRHFVLPPDPNAILSDDNLIEFAGGTGGDRSGIHGGSSAVVMGSTTSPFANYFDPI